MLSSDKSACEWLIEKACVFPGKVVGLLFWDWHDFHKSRHLYNVVCNKWSSSLYPNQHSMFSSPGLSPSFPQPVPGLTSRMIPRHRRLPHPPPLRLLGPVVSHKPSVQVWQSPLPSWIPQCLMLWCSRVQNMQWENQPFRWNIKSGCGNI